MLVKEHRTSDYLKTPEAIAAYLNAIVEEMVEDPDPRLLMLALRDVAEAQGGVSELARQTGINRASLSRALAGRHTPRLDTFAKITGACGVKLRFSA